MSKNQQNTMVKDLYHDFVKEALEKDGWLITHDTLPVVVENDRWEIDLEYV